MVVAVVFVLSLPLFMLSKHTLVSMCFATSVCINRNAISPTIPSVIQRASSCRQDHGFNGVVVRTPRDGDAASCS